MTLRRSNTRSKRALSPLRSWSDTAMRFTGGAIGSNPLKFGEEFAVSSGRGSRMNGRLTFDGFENVCVDGPDVKVSGEWRGVT